MNEHIEEYQTAVRATALCADILAQHDILKILADIERADSVGPLVDPTLWRDKHRAMLEDKELLLAALPLQKFGKVKP